MDIVHLDTDMNNHDPLHRTCQGDWLEAKNRNSCVLAPVIALLILHINSAYAVEHTMVKLFLIWGSRLTFLPCFEHSRSVCSHYSLIRTHITVSIHYQKQQMQTLSRTVYFTKSCELLLQETWRPSTHPTTVVHMDMLSWSPPFTGTYLFLTTVTADLLLAHAAKRVLSFCRFFGGYAADPGCFSTETCHTAI